MDWQTAYDKSQLLLKSLEKNSKELMERLEDENKASINYDSIRAQQTSAYDKKGISKTALKEIVSGDKLVMESKQALDKASLDVKKSEIKIKYIDHALSIEKRALNYYEGVARNFRE